MKRKAKEDFDKLCRILTEEKSFRRKVASFPELCEMSGVRRVKMENMFYEYFGMSGDDVLTVLRRKTGLPRI
jgi:hypothetical protein